MTITYIVLVILNNQSDRWWILDEVILRQVSAQLGFASPTFSSKILEMLCRVWLCECPQKHIKAMGNFSIIERAFFHGPPFLFH